jgi:hypothetical protein
MTPKKLSLLGALVGVVATELALGRLASGNSLMGLDLLTGALVGAATARRLFAPPVPRGLTVAAVTSVTILALVAVAAVSVASGWD